MTRFESRMREAIGPDRVRREMPLAPLTTFKVGGAAEWLVQLHAADEVRSAIAIAGEAGLAVTALGGGSNVLVADEGVRGLVIRIHGGNVEAMSPSTIRVGAGVTINGAVRWTVNRGVAGLEAWAGTPGTLGGAVFGNAHFRGRLVSELVRQVQVVSLDGRVADLAAADMEFAYDFSRLHRTREVVVSADLAVSAGEPADLRAVARQSLAFRKETQPLESPSAGCIFQNPVGPADHVPEGVPRSAGALVDRAGLKGAKEGRAIVSPAHANFIVNQGGASARDIRALIARCQSEVHDRFGVVLREEIVYLGFGGGTGE